MRHDPAIATAGGPARSAAIIPLPLGQARNRRVLTYPAAIAFPARLPEPAPALERPLSAMTLLALVAPTAALGSAAILLRHLLA
jgi:hypothetical protein